MKCELCGNEIEPYAQSFVPVLKHHHSDHTEQRGIHLSCLKEVVESVRAIGLTISQSRPTIETPNLEGTENA